MEQEDVFCIGIDLGTSNSVMAYVDKNRFPQTIYNSESENVTPSVVYWEQDEAGLVTATVGDDAVPYSYIRPTQTVKSIKRDMGENKTIKIFDNEMTPEEISSLILMKLKDDAELHFQKEVTHAIITVPAYFGENERVATQTAATYAGWKKENLQIMNEPTAAGYSFVFDRISSRQEIKNGEKVLIFDLGGGTFDCTIFEYVRESENKPGFLDEITKNGDSKLGGDDFDEVVFQWVADEHQKETGIDIREDLNATADVMKSVKNAKESLSKRKKRKIIVDLKPPLAVELTREKFDELCVGLYQKVSDIVDKTLKREHLKTPAPVNPEDINTVVMVGGSSKIKAMEDLIQKKFAHAEIFKYNPDLAIGHGAALYALQYFDQTDEKMIELAERLKKDFTVSSSRVTHNLGVLSIKNDITDFFSIIIPKDEPLPASGYKEYHTSEDNATSVSVKVFEGENETTTENVYIGDFTVSDIPAKPRGEEVIKVTFRFDDNNTLDVEATIKSTGQTFSHVFQPNIKSSQDDIEEKRNEMREQLPRAEA